MQKEKKRCTNSCGGSHPLSRQPAVSISIILFFDKTSLSTVQPFISLTDTYCILSSSSILNKQLSIAESDLPHTERLHRYLRTRFNIIGDILPRSKTPYDKYKSFFSRDIRRYEKIFEIERNKEQIILAKLLNDGVAAGVFNPQQAKTLPSTLSVIYSAIDQQLLHQTDIHEIDIDHICDDVISFVMVGITNDTKQ